MGRGSAPQGAGARRPAGPVGALLRPGVRGACGHPGGAGLVSGRAPEQAPCFWKRPACQGGSECALGEGPGVRFPGDRAGREAGPGQRWPAGSTTAHRLCAQPRVSPPMPGQPRQGGRGAPRKVPQQNGSAVGAGPSPPTARARRSCQDIMMDFGCDGHSSPRDSVRRPRGTGSSETRP